MKPEADAALQQKSAAQAARAARRHKTEARKEFRSAITPNGLQVSHLPEVLHDKKGWAQMHTNRLQSKPSLFPAQQTGVCLAVPCKRYCSSVTGCTSCAGADWPQQQGE